MNENKTVRPDDIPALIHEASARIDRALGEYYTCPDGSPAELYEAMRYSLLAGGYARFLRSHSAGHTSAMKRRLFLLHVLLSRCTPIRLSMTICRASTAIRSDAARRQTMSATEREPRCSPETACRQRHFR